MKGEVLIVIWVLIVSIIADQSNVKLMETIPGTGKKEIRYTKGFAVFAFLPIILWAGFRTGRGYADTNAYIFVFNNLPTNWVGLRDYVKGIEKDSAFYLYAGIIKILFGNSFTPFLLITAIIQGGSMIHFFRKFSPDYVFSLFLFIVSADYLGWMMNGTRQFLAVAIIYSAMSWLIERRYIRFALVVLFASLFHRSALIMLPVIFLIQGEPWNIRGVLMVSAAMLAILFVGQFTTLLNVALEDTVYEANLLEMSNQAGTNAFRVIVYSVPAAIALVGRNQLQKENNPLINISVNMSIVTAALYMISAVTSGIMFGRLPIYVSLFNYILLPYEMDLIFKDNKKNILTITIVLYLLYYYYLMHFAYGRI